MPSVSIEVDDHGPGLSEEQAERVFERSPYRGRPGPGGARPAAPGSAWRSSPPWRTPTAGPSASAGSGLGFRFTPINNVAYGALDPRDAQNVGVRSTSRASSVDHSGSRSNTYVTTRTQFHRVDLLTNVYAYNPGVVERLHALTGGLMAHGYTALNAQRAALGVDGMVMRQASMLSYNYAWMMILLSFVIASPALCCRQAGKAAGRGCRNALG